MSAGHTWQKTGLATWRWALAVLALLTGIYLLTTGGHTYAIDEESMFAMTENLWFHGNLAVDQGPPLRYSQYGPGQPVIALPFYVFGRLLLPFFPPEAENWLVRAVLSWFNPLVTASIGASVFLATCYLGYTRRVALGTALIYGLGTWAWPHSKTFFAEPLTALLLFGSFTLLLAGDRRWRTENREPRIKNPRPTPSRVSYLVSRISWPLLPTADRQLLTTFLSGLLAGAAVSVKIHAVLTLPAIALYVLLTAFPQQTGEHRKRDIAPASSASRIPHPAFRIHSVYRWRGIAQVVWWGVGLSLALGALAVFQWAAYGSPLRTGYGSGTGEFLGNSFSPGLYGLTLSPGKGLAWYAPPLFLLPYALWLFGRRSWRAAVACGLVVATNLLFFAQIFVWHGDGAWGPRYLNIMLPFAALPLAAYLDCVHGWATRWRTLALAALLVLAVPVQVGGLAIHFNVYINMQRDADKRYFTFAGSPIVQHLVLARQQLTQAYALHLAPDTAVLAQGWSYSEGNRKQADQTPRWSSPQAVIAVRASGSDAVALLLSLDGCRPTPIAPGSVTVWLGATALVKDTPCPARSYHLMLPPRSARLLLTSDAWSPQDAGIDRPGPLGVQLEAISGWVGSKPLAVAGRLVPIAPLPAGYVGLRNWFGDPRSGHWDFWWWYLAHSGLPLRSSVPFATAWAGLALALLVWGGWSLWQLAQMKL